MGPRVIALTLLVLMCVSARPLRAQTTPGAVTADPPLDAQHPPGLAMLMMTSHGTGPDAWLSTDHSFSDRRIELQAMVIPRPERLGVAHPASAPTQAQAGSPESDVREALARFIRAFDNLEWDGFRLAFADDATVFYPRAFPERANGRGEFEETFRTVFEQIRGGKTAAPYMDIQPKNMVIQMFGDTAIATFHLDDRPGFLNRRTIVLHKSAAGWKIVHLHASEVATSR